MDTNNIDIIKLKKPIWPISLDSKPMIIGSEDPFMAKTNIVIRVNNIYIFK